MPTNFNTAKARFLEVAACTCADMLVRQLSQLNTEPNGKMWNRQRDQRRDLWRQLAESATAQVDMLSEPLPMKRRTAKPRPITPAPSNGTDTLDVGAAASA